METGLQSGSQAVTLRRFTSLGALFHWSEFPMVRAGVREGEDLNKEVPVERHGQGILGYQGRSLPYVEGSCLVKPRSPLGLFSHFLQHQ